MARPHPPPREARSSPEGALPGGRASARPRAATRLALRTAARERQAAHCLDGPKRGPREAKHGQPCGILKVRAVTAAAAVLLCWARHRVPHDSLQRGGVSSTSRRADRDQGHGRGGAEPTPRPGAQPLRRGTTEGRRGWEHPGSALRPPGPLGKAQWGTGSVVPESVSQRTPCFGPRVPAGLPKFSLYRRALCLY